MPLHTHQPRVVAEILWWLFELDTATPRERSSIYRVVNDLCGTENEWLYMLSSLAALPLQKNARMNIHCTIEIENYKLWIVTAMTWMFISLVTISSICSNITDMSREESNHRQWSCYQYTISPSCSKQAGTMRSPGLMSDHRHNLMTLGTTLLSYMMGHLIHAPIAP